MKWEWAIGEVALLIFAFYELWSLRKYDRRDTKKNPTDKT
jgi:hypothetical protein